MHDNYLKLSRDAFGRLVLQTTEKDYVPVNPVRSFPITARSEAIALVDANGAELWWVSSLDELAAPVRALLEDELASREFIPHISRINKVSSFATPSHWQVDTDRGAAVLLLKSEEDIRRLSASRLLIADGYGVQFLIRDVNALDKASRRLLDHFL